jgi:hypothetical protein
MFVKIIKPINSKVASYKSSLELKASKLRKNNCIIFNKVTQFKLAVALSHTIYFAKCVVAQKELNHREHRALRYTEEKIFSLFLFYLCAPLFLCGSNFFIFYFATICVVALSFYRNH